MVDNETLLAISDLLDNKLKPIYEMQRQNNERLYQIAEIDALKLDNEILKKVVLEHSRKLQAL